MNQRLDPYTGKPIEVPSYMRGLPPPERKPASQQTAGGAGLSTGRRELQGLGGAFVGNVGNVAGLEGVQRAGEAYSDKWFGEAAKTARQDLVVPPWESRETPIGSWLAYETARQVPQLAAQLVASRFVPKGATSKTLDRAGANLPKIMGGGGARPGMSVAERRKAIDQGQEFGRTVIGSTAAGYPLGVGAMYSEAMETGEVSRGEAARAMVMGVPYAALDAFQPTQLQGLLRQGLTGNIAKRIVTAGLVGGVSEMPQEAIQTAMELTFRPDMSQQEKMRQIVNAALTGGAVGGVIGGAGGLRRMKSIDPAAVTNEDLQGFTEEVMGSDGNTSQPQQPQQRGWLGQIEAQSQQFEAGTYPTEQIDPTAGALNIDPMASETERLQAMSRAADPRMSADEVSQRFNPLAGLPREDAIVQALAEPSATQSEPQGVFGQIRARREQQQQAERPLKDVSDAELKRAYEIVQTQGGMVADERGARAIDAIVQEVQIRTGTLQANTQQDADAAVAEMQARAKQLAGGRDSQFIRELDARNETELTARVIQALDRGNDGASLMRMAQGLGVLDADGQQRKLGDAVQNAEIVLQQVQARLARGESVGTLVDAASKSLDALREEQGRLDAAYKLARGEVDAVQPAQASEQGNVEGTPPTQPEAQTEATTPTQQQVAPAAPLTLERSQRVPNPTSQLAATAANVEPVGAIGEQLQQLLGAQVREDDYSAALGQRLEQQTTQMQRAGAEPVKVQSMDRVDSKATFTLSNGERVVAQKRLPAEGVLDGWYGPNNEYLGKTPQNVGENLVALANKQANKQANPGEQQQAQTEDNRIDMRKRRGSRATIRHFRKTELERRAERPRNPRVAPERIKKLQAQIKREMKRMGVSDKIAVEITDRLDATMKGLYLDGRITIDALLDDVEVIGAVRHELIHMLRDPDIWGKPYGLFTKQEWDTLVDAASQRSDIVNRVNALYSDQPLDVRQEEMVAELYREWAAGRPAQPVIRRIMDKIQAMFHGMIAAFEGAGQFSSSQLLLRVANGTIGSRAQTPQGGGMIRRAQRAWHGTHAVFDRFSMNFLGTGVGHQTYGWGLYFDSQKDMAAAYRDKLTRKHGTQTFRLQDNTQYDTTRPGHPHIKGLFDTYPNVTQMARDRRRGSLEENLKDSKAYLKEVQRDGSLPREEANIQREIEALQDAIDVIDTVQAAPGGSLFEVDIPNDDRLMDYDATLANQPPQVREAMKSILPVVPDTKWVNDEAGTAVYAESEDGGTIGAIQIDPATNEYTVLFTDFRGGYVRVGTYPDTDAAVDAMANYDPPPILEGVSDQMPAHQAYQLIGQALTPRTARLSDTQKAASLALAEAGVPGHIYRELNSTEDADRNFVMYDEDAIKVVGRQSRKGLADQLSSPVQQADAAANAAVSVFHNAGQRALAKVQQKDFAALSTAARRAMLYASTNGHISNFFGPMFKSGGTKKLLDADRTLKTIEQQLSHISTLPYRAYQRLERRSPKAVKAIGHLMGMTGLNIDPRRPWREQTWLHASPDADFLQQQATIAHREYKNLERNKQLEVYNDFLAANDMVYFAQQTMALYHVASTQPGMAKLMGYDNNPMMDFMQRSDLHESPAAARAYWQKASTDLMAKAEKFEATQRGLTDSMTTQDRRLFENHTSMVRDSIEKIKEQQAAMQRAPNFHLGRFGDFFASFTVRSVERTVDGKKVRTADRKAMRVIVSELKRAGIEGVTIAEGGARNNVFLRFKSETVMNNAFAAIQTFKKRGLLDNNVEPKRGSRKQTTTPTRANEQVKALKEYIASSPAYQIDNDMTDDQKKLVDDARKRVLSHIDSFALDLLPDTSIDKIMVHRDMVPGWSSDMVRAYAFRMAVGSHALANMTVAPMHTEAFTQMKGDINDAMVDPNQDVVGMQDVLGELMIREAQRPQHSGHNFLDLLRAINHAYFLGMSPSYVMVNMTQVPVLLWPELSKNHGYAKSFQAIAKVTPLALKVIHATIKRGVGLGVRGAPDATVTESVLREAGIGRADSAFIMRIVNTGVIDIGSPSRELGRIKEDRMDSKTDLSLRYASAAGFYSEMAIRLIAALSTRELEGSSGISDQQLQDRVVHVVDQSMFNYSTNYISRMSGKGGFLGRGTPLALAFLQYSFQLTEKLFRELHTGFMDNAASKAEQKAAKRFLAAHLTAITGLAGTLGLPMATVFARVINAMVELLGDDDEPYDVMSAYRNMLTDVFGPEVGEIIARGAPRAAGFDISKRVGEQDLIPNSKLIADRRDWEEKVKDWAFDSLGSPASMISNVIQGGTEMARGNMLEGAKALLPVGFKGPIEAYRMSANGYVDRAGNKLPMEAGAWDILVQVMGFSPAEKAEYSEAKMAQTVRKGVMTRRSAELRKKIAIAIERGDREEARKLFAEGREWDEANPGYPVMGGLSSVITSRARAGAMAERFGVPLGTNIKDPGANTLTGYANY